MNAPNAPSSRRFATNRARVFAALLGATAILAGCSREPPPTETVRPVLTRVVGGDAESAGRIYAGEVRARHEHDLAFRVGGKIVSRTVEIGERVRAGAVLARLDPQDAQLSVAASRSQVAAAEADLTLARAELARYRTLYEKRFVSAAVLDARQSAFDAATARLDQARSQLASSGNLSSYTTLVAERDGVILSAAAEPGQVVSAGQPVFRFARSGEKEVSINVPEQDLAALRGAPGLGISLWAAPGRAYRGRLRELAPAADPASRTYSARISIADDDGAVELGMSAEVRITPGSAGRPPRIPLTALFHRDGQPAVWLVEGDAVRLAPVSTGSIDGNLVEVRRGLDAGQRIVTAGTQLLRPGQKVRVLDDHRDASR